MHDCGAGAPWLCRRCMQFWLWLGLGTDQCNGGGGGQWRSGAAPQSQGPAAGQPPPPNAHREGKGEGGTNAMVAGGAATGAADLYGFLPQEPSPPSPKWSSCCTHDCAPGPLCTPPFCRYPHNPSRFPRLLHFSPDALYLVRLRRFMYLLHPCCLLPHLPPIRVVGAVPIGQVLLCRGMGRSCCGRREGGSMSSPSSVMSPMCTICTPSVICDFESPLPSYPPLPFEAKSRRYRVALPVPLRSRSPPPLPTLCYSQALHPTLNTAERAAFQAEDIQEEASKLPQG